MQILKIVKVTNPQSNLIQIPKAIAALWNLEKGDGLEVYLTEGGEVCVKPRKGLFNVQP